MEGEADIALLCAGILQGGSCAWGQTAVDGAIRGVVRMRAVRLCRMRRCALTIAAMEFTWLR